MIDLYVTNVGPNLLYRNSGRGRFTEVPNAGRAAGNGWSTSCAFLDIDRDGSLDLFVTDATVEYLAAAILDMDLHLRPDGDFDPARFEREGLTRIGMPREIALRHRLPQFDHLFGNDNYSAGYYSYLWSEVMAADTWKAFLEASGPWDEEVALRFRAYILAEGNSVDRADAYRRFRGRDPHVEALFEERGFPVN